MASLSVPGTAAPARRAGESVAVEEALGRVLIVDPIDEGAVEELRRSFDVVVHHQPDEDELERLARDADVLILRSGVRLTARVIEAATNLKVVARAGMGTDNIDLAAAERAGIVVFNVPGESAWAVAEFTFGLILAIARKIALADAQVRANEWKKAALMGTELRGKAIGVVGHGHVGSKVAELALTFGMRVLTCVEREVDGRREELAEKGIELVDFRRILEESDVVCLVVPLTERTRDLVTREELELMKPSAYLVNICRAAVVNEPDLHDALERRVIAGAALDVLGEERKPTRLASLDNVVLSPHIAAMTDTSQQRIGRIVIDSIRASLDGRPVANRLA